MKRKVGRPRKIVETQSRPTTSPKTPTEDDERIGALVANLRKSQNMSQIELGEALGVTFQQVQKYETGTNRIVAARLSVIARVLKVPLSTFFSDGDDDAAQVKPESLNFLKVPDAVDLLSAYTSIADDDMRREVLAIVRGAARLTEKPRT